MSRKRRELKAANRDVFLYIMCFIIIVAIVVTIVNFTMVKQKVDSTGIVTVEKTESYKYHFALIHSDNSDELWDSVYKSANAYAMENDAYVEVIGANLPETYTKEELMEIAILSDVDGIIVEGDESPGLADKIQSATENGIPVVTVMTDTGLSERNSYVGISSYDVGLDFGRQIIAYKESMPGEKVNVMVLMSSGDTYSNQHTMYLGIMDKLSGRGDNSVEVQLLKNETEFSMDEAIRDILINLDEEPDIMVCLSEEITESAYQAVVEYNKVGTIDVMGYATNDAIYNAVEKELIKCVLSLDDEMMGIYCAEALLEYINVGYVSEYMMVDTALVTKSNVKEFLKDEND